MTSKVQPLIPDFLEDEVTVRGVTYRFRELSISDYDDLVARATTPQPNQFGVVEDMVNNTLLLKLMVIKCSTTPKLTAEVLASMPMRAALTLNRLVNRMHYGDEPEPEKKDEADEEEDGKKGND
jgi:hypothetical protein